MLIKSTARVDSTLRVISIELMLAALTLLLVPAPVHAQDDRGFTLSANAGFSPLVGDISKRLDNGWHVAVDGGYDFSSHFSTTLEYMYNGYGVSRRVLSEAHVPDGNSHMWAFTVNPKLRLNRRGNFSPYVVGGVGYYRRTIEFTTPAVVPVLIVDPFFGFVFNTLVPANRVLGDITRSGVGGSAGAGFEVKLGDSGAKFFTEARYHYADTGRIPTRMVPVSFGVNLTPDVWRRR